jgi:hypothetical protein
MAWDLSNSTKNNNLQLKKAWGIYTPQRRKLVESPRAAPVRPVFEKLVVGASGTNQTGAPDRSDRSGPSPSPPPSHKSLSKKLALHHRDEMAQVRLGGFVSTL